MLQHLRHVVLLLEDGGDEGAEERGLEEPDEGPEREAREVRRLQLRRLVPDGGDVHLLHRRHRARHPLPPAAGSAAHLIGPGSVSWPLSAGGGRGGVNAELRARGGN